MFGADRTMVFVDGENLVQRYQASLKEGFKAASNDVRHIPDALVWRHAMTTSLCNIVRVSYYTTFTGDSDAIAELTGKISATEYRYRVGIETSPLGLGRLVPHIFKKEGRSAKTKSVDINLAIDALRHTYGNSLDVAVIFTSDGDYIPLIQEIMRQGKQVIVGGLRSGLHPALPTIADAFLDLTPWLLAPAK
jgi:uncharacterized LabA/DUF88 family protein